MNRGAWLTLIERVDDYRPGSPHPGRYLLRARPPQGLRSDNEFQTRCVLHGRIRGMLREQRARPRRRRCWGSTR